MSLAPLEPRDDFVIDGDDPRGEVRVGRLGVAAADDDDVGLHASANSQTSAATLAMKIVVSDLVIVHMASLRWWERHAKKDECRSPSRSPGKIWFSRTG
jgi:hypothetical protein